MESSSSFVGGLQETKHLEGNKNYSDWKFWMKNFLVDAGLWTCVENPNEVDSSTDMRCLAKINMSVKGSNHEEEAYALRYQNRNVASQVQCYRCKKFGHKSNRCLTKKSDDGKNVFIASCNHVANKNDDKWYFDSGASTHITKNPVCLFNTSSDVNTLVGVANGEQLKCTQKGTVEFCLPDGRLITASDVSYVPGIQLNLLSVHQITQKGNSVVFNNNMCYVIDHQVSIKKHTVIATGKVSNGLYCLEVDQNHEQANVVKKPNEFELWHKRLAHLNVQTMKSLEKGIVTGVSLHGDPPENCEMYVAPMRIASLGGSVYFVTFTDDHSRKSYVYFMKSKCEVFDKFLEFKALVENQTGKTIKTVRSDNGTEYVNNKFKNYLAQNGILLNTSAPYTPEQNGLAERLNRTLLEKARSMLFQSGLEEKFWAEAIATAVYLKNVLPTQALQDKKTPEEVWCGRKPNLKHLKVFGCKALVHVPKKKRSKWDPQAEVCVFIGYCETSKNYRVIQKDSLQVTKTRNVSFYENVFPALESLDVSTRCDDQNCNFMTSQIQQKYNLMPVEVGDIGGQVQDDDQNISQDDMEQNSVCSYHSAEEQLPELVGDIQPCSLPQPVGDVEDTENSPQPVEDILEADNEIYPTDSREETNIELRRSTRKRKPNPKYYNDYTIVYSVNGVKTGDPMTYKQAMERDDKSKWQQAMKDEVSCHIKNKTFEICDVPPGKKPVKSKWVFKTKYNVDGTLNKYKARLVAKGYSQQEGIDYEEVFAPVVRHTSIRLLLALAVELNLSIDQMDVVTAFLHPKLDEEIYMELPRDDQFDGKCCKLLKSIYGLKQASHVWNLELDKALKNLEFQQSKYDPCVYIRRSSVSVIYVSVYVDDLLIFSNNEVEKNRVKSKLMETFQMKDLGPAHYILGYCINYKKQEKCLTLDQSKYIQEVLHRFNMADCNGTKTPMDPNQIFSEDMLYKSSEKRNEVLHIPYQEAIGSLLYIAQGTRPDIMYAVSYLSRFNNSFGPIHWNAVKRIMRYLKQTIDLKLTYKKNSNKDLYGFSDADWASDTIERKSTTGYAFFLSGGAISWNSKKQPTIALSTTEAEYMALSNAVQEAIWLKGLKNELIQSSNNPILLYGDNKSAIDLSKNAKYQARTKHIDVCHHFIRDYVQRDVIKIKHVSTKEMVADNLTKALTFDGHSYCTQKLLNMA
ncbi:hypothetical protein WDU94_013979 [Cyamophila willieti]